MAISLCFFQWIILPTTSTELQLVASSVWKACTFSTIAFLNYETNHLHDVDYLLNTEQHCQCSCLFLDSNNSIKYWKQYSLWCIFFYCIDASINCRIFLVLLFCFILIYVQLLSWKLMLPTSFCLIFMFRGVTCKYLTIRAKCTEFTFTM